jgi:putative membrane protein
MKKTISLLLALSVCVAGISLAAQGVTSNEKTFMQKAAQSDETEISLAKLAFKQSTNAQIKQFAQMMITDHTKSTSLLKPIAAQDGVALPTSMGTANEAKYKALEKKSGEAFDKGYVDTMVSAHQSLLQEVQAEAGKAQDPKLKQFIATVEPVVSHHLQMAKQLQQGLKAGKTS